MAKNTVPEPRVITRNTDFCSDLEAYLRSGYGLDRGISTENVEKMVERKTELAGALGIGVHDYVVFSGTGALSRETAKVLSNLIRFVEHYPEVCKMASEVGVDTDPADLWAVYGYPILRYGQKFKVVDGVVAALSSEVVLDAVDFNKLTYTYGGRQRKLIRQIRKLPANAQIAAAEQIVGYFQLGSVPYIKDDTPNHDIIFTKLGDALTKLQDILVLTCDPLGVMRQSDNRGACGSCHRAGGEYQLGSIGYAQDPCTFVVYQFSNVEGSTDEWRYIYSTEARGRCLFMLPDPGNPAFIQSRMYGQISSESLTPVRAWVESRLRKRLRPESAEVWEKVAGPSVYRTDQIYVDTDHFTCFALGRAAGVALQGWQQPWVDGGVYCPVCGQYMEEQSTFECGCVALGKCEECGEWVYPGDGHEYTGESYLCEQCSEPQERCARCGGYHHIEELTYLDTEEEEYWCGHCVDYYAVTCHQCGQLVHSANTEDAVFGGVTRPVCQSCASAMDECTECGRLCEELTECNGEYLCEECEDNYSQDHPDMEEHSSAQI